MQSLHVVLMPVGSSGDVHPFLGLGLELKRRGHQVTVLVNGHFRCLVRQLGLDFVELGTDEQYRQVLSDPDIWHPLRGFERIVGALLEHLRPAYDKLMELYEPGRTIVVGSSLALSARVAQDKWDIPTATVHLAPAVFRSIERPPKLAGLWLPDWSPRWYRRLMFRLADVLVVDRLMAPPINTMRQGLGLPPVRRILDHWWNSPQRVIALFPSWYASDPGDWPPQTVQTGFPLFDEREAVDAALDEQLRAYLEAGEPPVVMTPGSANIHGRSFFASGVAACAKLGRRCLLLTRFAEQLPHPLPAHAMHLSFVPFSRVLPYAAAVVHHGGIGSCAQGLAAGVPQLIMPMSHDQFDNADRLKRLGVSDWLSRRGFTPDAVAGKLQALISSEAVRRACRTIAPRLDAVAAIRATCDAIEALRPLSVEAGVRRPAPSPPRRGP